jgi:hypothetical protein
MRLSPVRRYRPPSFPTRVILNTNPGLLRLAPRRWRSNPIVLTSLATLCLLMVGCRGAKNATAPATSAQALLVAPIFHHGDGRGSWGCVVINPPVFLSEAEARSVIEEEAKQAGLKFSSTARIKDVRVPITDSQAWLARDGSPLERAASALRPRTQLVTLELDGVDTTHEVGYEFISQDDFRAWEKTSGASSESEYSMVDAAEGLTAGLAASGAKGTYGVFYDPMPAGTRTQSSKDVAEGLLREQVRDFISWLTEQGVV